MKKKEQAELEEVSQEVETHEEPEEFNCPNCQELEDKLKRSLAEVENQRKRFETEKSMMAKFAAGATVQEFLPVLDNFYRALEHVPEDQKSNPWTMGVEYIQKQFVDTLDQLGVKEIPTKKGDVYDHAKHEAIGTTISDEVPEDHIISINLRGYTLNDRVIRPVQVTVAKAN